MPNTLTKRQHQVLTYVQAYIEEHGYAPTFEEIGAYIGVALSTVHEHVDNLVRKGRLLREQNRPRALRVITYVEDAFLPGVQWVPVSELPRLFGEWLQQRGLPDDAQEVLRAALRGAE